MSELSSIALKCNQAANRAVVRTDFVEPVPQSQTKEWEKSLRSVDQSLNTILLDLQATLDSLTSLAEEENAFTEGGQQRAFLVRCRTVLQDTRQERVRIFEMGKNALWRLSLYEDDEPHSSIEDEGVASARSHSQTLLSEHSKLQESLQLLEDTTAMGGNTHQTMLRTSENYRLIKRGIERVGSMFPTINNLIGTIRRHRHRDAIVIATVIALCLCFTVIYVSRK